MKALLLVFLVGCGVSLSAQTKAVEGSTLMVGGDVAMGTAWVVSPGYAVTAGHVCEINQAGKIWARSVDQTRQFPGEIVEFDTSAAPQTHLSTIADVCVLKIPQIKVPDVYLADDMPLPGTPITEVGFPHGIFTISTGVYLGNAQTTAYGDHGMSGGAVVSDVGIIGLVDAKPGEGGEFDPRAVTVIVEISEIKSLLRDAGVPWQTFPKLPSRDPFPAGPGDL